MKPGGTARTSARIQRWQRHLVLAALAASLAAITAAGPRSSATADHVGGPVTRAEVIARAANWYAQREQIPYNQGGKFADAEGREYRTDCSGFVSMAWHLASQVSTRSLPAIAHVIGKEELQAGDVLNAAYGVKDPDGTEHGTGHVVLFVRWTSPAHTSYVGFEFGSTPVAFHEIPYPYYPRDRRTFVPYRYDRVKANTTDHDSVGWYWPGDGRLRALARNPFTAQSPTLADVPTTTPSVRPLLGDWNGDGIDEPGWYDRADGSFHLRSSNEAGARTVAFGGGPAGDGSVQPLAGDWNGDGTDTVGWFRPTDGTFHLLDHNANGTAANVFLGTPTGDSSLQVIAGDWDGNGDDTPGWFRPGDGTFHLLAANRVASPTVDVAGAPKNDATVLAVAGDWNGDAVDGIGWFRTSDGTLQQLSDTRTQQWTRVQQPAATGATVQLLVGRLAFALAS